VAIEVTCNTHAIDKLIEPRVARIVVSNPIKTRAIAEAKVKTDKVDAEVLAQLLAADYLPAVWLCDEETHVLRPPGRLAPTSCASARGSRTRCRRSCPATSCPCPAADLFGHKGRRWLHEPQLPADQRQAVEALLRQLDFHGEELKLIDAEARPDRPGTRRGEAPDMSSL
jgi:transposase